MLRRRSRLWPLGTGSRAGPFAGGKLDTAGHSIGDTQERQIIAALGDLKDTIVREVMTPRVDVVALAIPVHAGDVARAVRQSGHSRFPVYDEDLDHLTGVLFVNDLFRAGWDVEAAGARDDPAARRAALRPSAVDISRRLRQPYLVPESRLVLEVLADMRRDRRAFALVVDEYGGVAGLVTIKDVLSALVGDLRDELDPAEEPDIIRVDRSRWLVDGGVSIDDVRAKLGLALPEGEYVTLGGFLFDALGHIPGEGEHCAHDGWDIQVVEMDRRRIAKVVIHAPRADVGETGGDLGPRGARGDVPGGAGALRE
jgi:CBS domain containing-hemolysin-like protein